MTNEVHATAKMKDEEGNVTGEKQGTVTFDFGENIEQSASMFGGEVVHSQFKQAAIVALQGVLRRGIQSGKEGADLQAIADNWRPGVKTTTRKSAQEKISDAFGGLSDEEKKELLKQLRQAA